MFVLFFSLYTVYDDHDCALVSWNRTDVHCRPMFYAYGLMSRYFRGPSDAYAISDVTDPLALPAACVQQHDSKLWSVAALNLDSQPRSAVSASGLLNGTLPALTLAVFTEYL